MARSEQAAQEEAAAEARGRGRPFGRGRGRAAPARAPAAGRGRGRGPVAGAAPRAFGEARRGDEADEEEVDEEIDAEPAQQPPPPPPTLAEIMDRQTQLLSVWPSQLIRGTTGPTVMARLKRTSSARSRDSSA
jgi:hypothetical protein